MSEILLAIDPGDVESAFCFIDIDTYKPLYFAKEENKLALKHMADYAVENDVRDVALEMIASYGMSVGSHVFRTCVEIGRFSERLENCGCKVTYIYRKDEKLCICGQVKAKDSNIRQALIDRFAQFDFKAGKGTKKNPDWFHRLILMCHNFVM